MSGTTTDTSSAIYFWKPHEPLGYLGQWYTSPFTVDGVRYETAEMWMMVQKAKLFGDEEVAAQMAATTDPKIHKALGRKVKKFKEEVWVANRLRIVEEGNYHKFTIAENAEELRGYLRETGDRELVEASALDKIWGVGYNQQNAEANRAKWGLNLLGIALMNTRSKLKEEGRL